MSAERWQAWMALLPCERCGWDPDEGCTCTTAERSPAELRARHRAAVSRAYHSGWPVRTLSEVRADRVSLNRIRGAA